jgi:hypothetical protein
LIDPDDLPVVTTAPTSWHSAPYRYTFYVERGESLTEHVGRARRPVRLHIAIMGPPPAGFTWDHINRNGLDNRRSNLRLATGTEQIRNTRTRDGVRWRGVSQHLGRGGWRATAKVDGRSVHIGTFESPEEAARAYDHFVRTHYGQFAVLNFPEGR